MNIQEFTEYFNSFYGIEGIYPNEHDTTVADITQAVHTLVEGGHDFCGDSFDREKVRDLIFTQEEQDRFYSKEG